MTNNYLTTKIETNKKIEASPFTADELNALRNAARLGTLRALRFDNTKLKAALTNANIDESERLHDVADKAFDVYNDAMKVVQTFAATI